MSASFFPRNALLPWIVFFVSVEGIFYILIDQSLARYFYELRSTSPAVFDFFEIVTVWGLSKWYLIFFGFATVFCAFLSRGKDLPDKYKNLFGFLGVRALFVFLAVAISGIVADIIKPLIGRARPTLWFHDTIYGFVPFTFDARFNSMPSGHTTTVFALAFSLPTFFPRLRFLWLSGALAVGFSRIVLTAHFASDVFAGAVLGWLSASLIEKYGMGRVAPLIFPIDGKNPLK